MAGKVTYKEPASYFNADMKKAAKEYDRKLLKRANNGKAGERSSG